MHATKDTTSIIDRDKLRSMIKDEVTTFIRRNPTSASFATQATSLFGGVPMTWMNKRATPFSLYLDRAKQGYVWDVDGHQYIDFCLGDTGSMAGHSPEPVIQAVNRRMSQLGGLSAMLPTTDAQAVGAELARRFGLPQWSFTLTATDANRWALRLARAVTSRPKILVNSYCYHGSVDESLIVTDAAGHGVSRDGNVGAPSDVTATSRVAEFNDLAQLELQLACGDVAAVLMEPALTNVGIVTPEPGYHDGVRRLTKRYGSLLIIDETHTLSAGPGGATRSWGLTPDVITLGKSIGGGIPAGAYGLSAALSRTLLNRNDLDLVDMGGVGGTLAGSALSMAAMRATLEDVLTEDAFTHMIETANRFVAGVNESITTNELPWSVGQIGARAEYRFTSPAPRNGTEAEAASDPELDDFWHVYMANRGVLLTPFHNMALMCPETKLGDVDTHTQLFNAGIKLLTS